MTDDLPALADAAPAPRLRVVSPSLVTAMPSAMLLVDYALGGKATPTTDPAATIQAMPTDLVDESQAVRAVLAHGAALRSVLLARLPADHAGHTEWRALRSWIADLEEERFLGLLEFGAHAVLRYDRADGPPVSDADRVHAPAAELADTFAAALTDWGGIDDVAGRAAQLLDVATTRTTLLRLLDVVWESWLGRTWTEQLPDLRRAAERIAGPPPGCGGAQWVTLVSELRPDTRYAAAADRATQLTLAPCPGLGRSLTMFGEGEETWVLFSPQNTDHRPAGHSVERAGIPVGRLARLAPTMHALGDRTRLGLVLHLAEHGPEPMPRLADELQVHQSTVSRQVATLRSAGLVRVDENRYVALETDAVRRTCHTLLEALE